MTQIIVVQSFRGGTGKSTIAANLATYLSHIGKSVVLLDADVKSPGVHSLFGLSEQDFEKTFTDWILDSSSFTDIVYDITQANTDEGSLYLVPSSMAYGDAVLMLTKKQNQGLLRKALENIMEHYAPDYIFVDTHPGINEEVLLSATFADRVLSIMRPDQQDFQGVNQALGLLQQLNAKTHVVVNKAHPKFDMTRVVEEFRSKSVDNNVETLRYDENIFFSDNRFRFVLDHPSSQFSQEIKILAEQLQQVAPQQIIAQ